MGVISASTGLSSGIDITGTITKLMAINAQPVNALTTTDTNLTNQETAVTQLSALLLSVQNITQTLGQAATYGSQTATSSDTSALAATVTGAPTAGTYRYTPLQMAQSQQLLSSGFQSATQALGGGTLTFRYGNTVNQGVSLSEINGGKGFTPGEIRITDRSGASAVIDLSNAQNIDDVVQAINSAGTIDVTASTDDGHIVLTDNTGQSNSALTVQEVNGGTTAASLGLSKIDLPATSTSNSVAGADILTLSGNLSLNVLNDGMGVETNTSSLGDIDYTLQDGQSGTIDLSQLGSNPTLGDVIQQINTQSNGDLQASISANGQNLVVKDTTSGNGAFSLSNAAGSTAASDLGLVASAAAGIVTSSQILGGLNATLGGISYTLHNGTSGTINLSQLGSNPTLGDVIQQINAQSDGNLQASMSTDGQSLVVEDTTSGSGAFALANATGSTAASDLGLVASTTAGTITGSQILAGLNIVLGGINYTLQDGQSGTIDLSQLSSSSTLGDVIQQINAQSGGGLQASISGQSLVVKDTTSGGGTFSLSNAAGSTAASDLGLVASAATGVTSITGSQVLGGLNTVLLSNLNGGQGLGTLGSMTLSDGNGNSVNVNLAGAVTLQDVIDAINSQIETQNTRSAKSGGPAVDITAQVNSAGDGIQLTDTSGGAAPLTAANGSDGLDTATKLGFATATGPGSSSTGTLNSGDMHLQTVSQNTLLSSYNGGTGVALGTFRITDSAGHTSTIQVSSSMQTIGDVINAINRNTTGVHAAINSTGDGIVLTDTAGGAGTLSVTEGASTTGQDLNLLGAETDADGPQTIDGSTTRTITLKSTDTLTDLQNDINNLGAGLSAGILTAGSSNSYRLALTATQSGQAGNMIVDASQIGGMSLQIMAQGQDALLALGDASPSNAGASNAPIVVSSSSNTFSSVLPGVSLQINSASGQPVSVTVGNDGGNIATSLQTLVTDYNSFRSQLATDTAYNTTTNTGAVLSDDGSALQLDEQMSQLLTTSFTFSGPVQSLADVGITVQSDGTLSFNQSQFQSAWSANPGAVQQLFTTAKTGVSARFDTLINQLAGTTGSVLSARISALQQQIAGNQSTITQMNQRLSDEQNLLYTQFYNMDLTIGKLKNTQSLLSNITLLAPNTGVTSSSSG